MKVYENKEEDSQKALNLLKNLVYEIENKEDLLNSDTYKNAVQFLKKLHLKENKTAYSKQKIINESFTYDPNICEIVFPYDYFIKNGTKIINDFNYYGSIVLRRNDDKLFGLLFKDTGGDENDLYVKCHIYSWPQTGIIHGGQTFWCGTQNIGIEVNKVIRNVK